MQLGRKIRLSSSNRSSGRAECYPNSQRHVSKEIIKRSLAKTYIMIWVVSVGSKVNFNNARNLDMSWKSKLFNHL